jgi:nucleoside-diphosphate-sugar epimerase
VANGHLLAEARGQVGRRYVLGGQDVTLGQMLADIAALVGRKPPKVKLPIAPLFPIAAVAELGGMITGREPFVTLDRCAWRATACSIPARGPRQSWVITPGLTNRRWAMRSHGSAMRG